MTKPTTIIVGGGLAGLGAASALAERGVSVTLFESRPRLGGRAGSFVDETTGMWIDNCQHVSMGCCTNFEHFLNAVGLSQFLRTEPVLHFIGDDGVINHLSASRLPAPFHLFSAFRRLSFLSRSDLAGIAKGMRALAHVGSSHSSLNGSFGDWLAEHGQTSASVERFWHVVLVSALSESLDRIDVLEARKVFVDAFLKNRSGWQVRIPTVPLDELYGGHLTDWLTNRGASIRLRSGVERVLADGEAAVAVQLRNGERHTADHFIVAVPHHRVLSVLPESLQRDPRFSQIAELESAPISSVHLWFDRSPIALPHAVLIGRLSQWMFNRSVLQQSRGSRVEGRESTVGDRDPDSFARGTHEDEEAQGGQDAIPAGSLRRPVSSSLPSGSRLSTLESRLFNYQVVISASRNLAGRPQSETIAEVVHELTDIWPETANAKLLHSRLVTEHRAVLSVQPGSARFRPVQQSPLRNLQIAGDWTNTGWPGTMESAVRSGYLAAENILSHLGRPERLLQPDLAAGLLSKLLLGL